MPLLGRAAIDTEVKCKRPSLRKLIPHALPPVEIPVVDTDSFWDKRNITNMVRQSAIAAEIIAVVAISARSPVLSIMSRPPTFEMPMPPL